MMGKIKKDCAFQYYNGREVIADETELTLKEAKKLFNDHYEDMVEQVKGGNGIECAIWINMKGRYDYHDTLIHLHSPCEENGVLWEKKYITGFSEKLIN
ncbi:hypothetical protein [Flagellimonas nanhaiensis]|uniref:Uncharacterized protein n=1 Tax=Flagellimonas nanhaiensis TaxID=2292706 RepID=A0A371JNX1_9FLAO|nr:hypothetical protein [Allomuricauda nanhaiensis]RDY58915.1 hypothetical protein DX873_14750 [Allomuricauda nanhaiensis]